MHDKEQTNSLHNSIFVARVHKERRRVVTFLCLPSGSHCLLDSNSMVVRLWALIGMSCKLAAYIIKSSLWMRLEYELVEQSLPRYRQSQSMTCYQECDCHTVHKVTQCEGGTAGQRCSTMNNSIQSYRDEPGQVMIKSRHKWNITESKVQSPSSGYPLSMKGRTLSWQDILGCPLSGQDVPIQNRMFPLS